MVVAPVIINIHRAHYFIHSILPKMEFKCALNFQVFLILTFYDFHLSHLDFLNVNKVIYYVDSPLILNFVVSFLIIAWCLLHKLDQQIFKDYYTSLSIFCIKFISPFFPFFIFPTQYTVVYLHKQNLEKEKFYFFVPNLIDVLVFCKDLSYWRYSYEQDDFYQDSNSIQHPNNYQLIYL